MSSFTGRSLQQGKYTLAQELGRGGFGITYKAKNNVLAQDVVIKTINDALRQEPQFVEHQRHFQDEARRLAKCFHPNIVRVIDFFTEDGLPYIVMDYIPGQTLDQLVQPHQPLPEATALHYIRQVGDAVEAIHRAGLLHRDIKPQNLILQPDAQRVVLIDFGISREFTPGMTQAHTHMVTEGYAPIEQYLPQARRSSATDVYGLAATLYTLLTGHVPAAAILRDRIPLQPPHQIQPSLSRAVSTAVMRGMAVEPQDRPQQVGDWLALLPGSARTPEVHLPPQSQSPTVVVAPQYRPTVPVSPGSATVSAARPAAQPARARAATSTQPQRNYWLPGAIALSIVLPFVLGYGLLRNRNTLPAPTTPSEAVTTPSPNAVVEQPTPQPAQPSPAEPAPVPEEEASPTPSPEEQASPEPAAELEPPAEPTAPPLPPELPEAIQAQPNQPEEAAETSEAASREPEQSAEAARQQEEQQREAARQQEEQAREEARRQEEQERDAQREAEKKPKQKAELQDNGG